MPNKYPMFGTKYPIVCSPMFMVSDLNLGLAVYQAGCFPTFVDIQTAARFKEITGSSEFSIFFTLSINDDLQIFKDLLDLKPRCLDISWGLKYERLEILSSNRWISWFMNQCKKNDIKLILKATVPTNNLEYFSAINIKGKEGAGRTSSELSSRDAFLKQQKLSDVPICPAGGISTGKDIDWFMERGATAVYMGTAFSVTTESKIVAEVKQQMISVSSIQKINGSEKNGIQFSSVKTAPTDLNFNESLRMGIAGTGGHIYAGEALFDITEVMSVSELVSKLVSESSFLRSL